MKKFSELKIFERKIFLFKKKRFLPVILIFSLLFCLLISRIPLLEADQFNLKLLSKEAPSEEISLWYVVKLGDVPAGYAWEQSKKVRTSQGLVIHSSSQLKLAIKRLGVQVQLVSSSETEETEKGELLRSSLVMKLSNLETITRAEIGQKEIVARSSAGGQEYIQKIEYKERLLGPEGINRLTLSLLKKPGDEIEYSTYLPEVNKVIQGKRKAEGWEEVKLSSFSLPFKSLRVLETIEQLAIRRTLWFDQEGRLIQFEEKSPLGELKIYLATKEEALAAAEAEALTDIPFESTLIRSNVRLPSARSIEKIKLRLKFKEQETALPPYSSFYQRVDSIDKDSILLEIERPTRVEKKVAGLKRKDNESKLKTEAIKEIKEFLQANMYINIDDYLIKKTASELTKNIPDDWEKALRLRDWVSQNLIFDPGIVFALSKEVIRQRRGTCVSFALLLATLARASGLPARFIMGYAYLNGVWGGHAWTEIYLDGAWLPLDAALPSPDVADAARIALVATSLNQGIGEVIVSGQRFFSKVEIEILEYQLEGRIFKAQPKLYEIKDNKYFNFGLGLMVNGLDSMSFTELNKAWPDNILLVMKNEREEIRLLQQAWRPVKDFESYLRQLAGSNFSEAKVDAFYFQGMKAYRLNNKNQAVAFFWRGTDLWQVSVRSPEASKLMETALKAIEFKH